MPILHSRLDTHFDNGRAQHLAYKPKHPSIPGPQHRRPADGDEVPIPNHAQ